MHFSGWNANQTLWTLTFAALMVLLVVLLGKDRFRRFPWFSASMVLTTLRLLSSRLLDGRLPQIPMAEIFIPFAAIEALVTVLVAVEIARRAFAGASRRAWIIGTVALLAVGGVILAEWGAWPAWKTLTATSVIAFLQLTQLVAQKTGLLSNVLTTEVGLLVVLFGRRFNAGWRSHTQLIALGLSTAAIAQLAVRGIWQAIALHAAPHSQAELDRVLGIRDKLNYATSAVFLAALVWWIICLWNDEPGTEVQDSAGAEALPGQSDAAIAVEEK
jgi:hypothetical protein